MNGNRLPVRCPTCWSALSWNDAAAVCSQEHRFEVKDGALVLVGLLLGRFSRRLWWLCERTA